MYYTVYFRLNLITSDMIKNYRLYSPTALTNTCISVQNEEMSQKTAVLQLNVQKQTLHDRIISIRSQD